METDSPRASYRSRQRAPADRGHRHPAALFALTSIAIVACATLAWPLLTSLAWAAALAVVSWPVFRTVRRSVPGKTAASLLTVLLVLTALAVPIGVALPVVLDEAAKGYGALRAWVDSKSWERTLDVHPWVRAFVEWAGARVDLGDVARQAGSVLTALGSAAFKTSVVRATDFALVFFWLFFFLRDRDVMVRGVRRILPIPRQDTERLLRVAADTIVATVYGKVLVAVVQGTLGGLMFWWLGLPGAWFWAVVMALLSLIPLLGPPLVWMPAAAWLALQGEWLNAAVLVVWGTAIVGIADNLLYPVVVGRYLRLHTVPLLVSMFGGIYFLGAMGFFLGPVVLATTMVLLDVARRRPSTDPDAPEEPAPP